MIPPAAKDEAGAEALVRDFAERGVERVVLAVMPSPNWDDREIGPAALRERYLLSAEAPVRNWRVEVYDRAPQSLATVDTQFMNGIRLAAAGVGLERLSPGDVLPVWLNWTGDAGALAGGEKVTIQLLDANGVLVAQADRPFGAENFGADPTGYALNLPAALQPGNHRLIVAVYNPEADGAPRLLTASGKDHVELGMLAAGAP